MTVEDVAREQEKLLPKEDLTPYAGRWVALRDGLVVATSMDAVALRDDPRVSPGDTLLPVPAGGETIHIL
jgi:hypothetical protein